VQRRWAPPFLKVEADALLAAGYTDVGWREVSSEAFGLPNPKCHIMLVATAGPTTLVDSCLFSTVRRSLDHACARAAEPFIRAALVVAGSGALFRMH
jgi:hypothetical protein